MLPGSTAQAVHTSEQSPAPLQHDPAKHTCDQQTGIYTKTDGVCLSLSEEERGIDGTLLVRSWKYQGSSDEVSISTFQTRCQSLLATKHSETVKQ